MTKRPPTPWRDSTPAPKLTISTVRLEPHQWGYLRAIAEEQAVKRGRGRADISAVLRAIVDFAMKMDDAAGNEGRAVLFPDLEEPEPEIEPMNAQGLKMAREVMGLTQVQLAAKLGLNPMSISRMERGVQAVSERTSLAVRALLHDHRDARASEE